jgi:hypothetical protein
MQMLLLAVWNTPRGEPRTFGLRTANTGTLNMQTPLFGFLYTDTSMALMLLLTNYFLRWQTTARCDTVPQTHRVFLSIRWQSGNATSPHRSCAGSLTPRNCCNAASALGSYLLLISLSAESLPAGLVEGTQLPATIRTTRVRTRSVVDRSMTYTHYKFS